MSRNAFVILTAIAVSLPCAAARAQGVGTGSPTETTHILQPRSQPTGATEWEVHVGTTHARMEVDLDPAGPTWLKYLYRNGPPGSLLPEHRVYLYEHLTISGERSWTAWNQEVEAPGFEWKKGFPFPDAALLANGTVPSGLSIQTSGSILQFTFDPLPPGTHIDVFSGLLFHGADLPDSFDLRQYPVPEPAGALLAGVAAIALVAVRKPKLDRE